jgi:mono/diheme cytochrome c family protein
VNPLASSREGLKRGRAIFLAQCATCHGKGGKGDGPAAAFGMVTPRDLTAPAVQARLSDGEMFWKISKGRRVGSDVLMPASEDKIASEDLWRVVLFVRSLRPRQNPSRGRTIHEADQVASRIVRTAIRSA